MINVDIGILDVNACIVLVKYAGIAVKPDNHITWRKAVALGSEHITIRTEYIFNSYEDI